MVFRKIFEHPRRFTSFGVCCDHCDIQFFVDFECYLDAFTSHVNESFEPFFRLMSDAVDVSDKRKAVFVGLEECVDNTSSDFLASQIDSFHTVMKEGRFFEIAQLMIKNEQLDATLAIGYAGEDSAKNVIHDRKYDFFFVNKKLFKHKSL